MAWSPYEENREEIKTVKDIEKAKERYDKQSEVVAEAEHIKNLLFEDFVSMCRRPKNFYDYMQEMFANAFTAQGRETRKEKADFYTLESVLRKDFFNGDKKAKLNRVMQCGFEPYGYSCEIDYGKLHFAIDFPCLSHLSTSNIVYAHYGKIVLFECKKNVHTAICFSYTVEEIAEALSKYINEKEVKSDGSESKES